MMPATARLLWWRQGQSVRLSNPAKSQQSQFNSVARNSSTIMAKKSNSTDSKKDASKDRVVCRNRRAKHDYEILDSLVCGVVLTGSEVKSIRDNKVTIEDAYARIEGGQLWLHQCDIAEYANASMFNHLRQRPRKLLLNKRELRKFAEAGSQKGQTLVALEVSFVRGYVKVLIGIGRGRREHDKRQKLKKDDSDRSIREAFKQRQR